MPAPPTVTRWFASQYPSLQLAPQWLEECHTFLTENFTLTAPVLLKKIESQLLLSDLATSTVQHAGLFPANKEQTDVFFDNVKGGGVLVQVLEILEIGRPAHELLKLHRDKMEDRKVFKEQGRAVIRAINDVDTTQDGSPEGLPDTSAAEDCNGKAFPRSMLKMRLSDGLNEYVAIETKRIRDINMDDTPLGCKLMLKNVRCLRGILMLDETCCTVKGGSIPDLENDRDILLEALLVSRVDSPKTGAQGGPARPDRRHPAGSTPEPAQARGPISTARMGPPKGRSTVESSSAQYTRPSKPETQNARRPVQDDFDLLDDDEEFDEEALAILQEAEATEIAARARKAEVNNQSSMSVQGSLSVAAYAPEPSQIAAGSSSLSIKRATSSASRPVSRKPKRAAQVIDLDDSDEDDDDDDEVAMMLLSSDGPEEATSRRPETRPPRKVLAVRAEQPIEID